MMACGLSSHAPAQRHLYEATAVLQVPCKAVPTRATPPPPRKAELLPCRRAELPTLGTVRVPILGRAGFPEPYTCMQQVPCPFPHPIHGMILY